MPMQQEFIGAGEGLNWETVGPNTVIAKRVALDHDCLLASIGVYVKHPAPALDDQVHNLAVAVMNADGLLIAGCNTPQYSILLDSVQGEGGDDTPRWYQLPVGAWLEAGEYYIAVQFHRSPPTLQIAYDDIGTDVAYASGGAWFADLGWYGQSDTGKSFSIRANTIR